MVESILNPGPSRGSGVFPPQPRNIWKQKSLNLRFPAITIPLGILKCSGKSCSPSACSAVGRSEGFYSLCSQGKSPARRELDSSDLKLGLEKIGGALFLNFGQQFP